MGPPVPGTEVSSEKAQKVFQMWDAFWAWCHAKHNDSISEKKVEELKIKHLAAVKEAGFEVD